MHLVLEKTNTLSMKEMYKMKKLLAMLLYAISEIVQCDGILKCCKAVSTVCVNRLK